MLESFCGKAAVVRCSSETLIEKDSATDISGNFEKFSYAVFL